MLNKTPFLLAFLLSLPLLSSPLAMPSGRESLADGKPFPGLPYVTGGKGQLREIPFPDFPVKAGAIYVKFCLAAVKPGESVLLFDACGSPAWHDRFSFMLKMHENNVVEFYATIAGPPSKVYNSRTIASRVPIDTSVPHTVIYQWRNVNSGKSDLEATLWLDGVNIGAIKGSQSNVDLHGRPFYIGGGKGRSGVYSAKDCLTTEDFRVWKGEIPASELASLLFRATEIPLPEVPFIILPKIAKPLEMDGKIDDAFWSHAADLGPLFNYRVPHVACNDTIVKAAYDEKSLHLAWKAAFDARYMPEGQLVGERDASTWRGDSVELAFMTPSGKVHYIISAYGDIYDAFDNKPAWTGAANVRTRIGNGEWTGEISIPLAELKASPGQVIQGTVNRNVKSGFSDSRSWVHEGFAKTGRLQLGGSSPITVSGVSLPTSVIVGRNSGSLSVVNSSSEKTPVEIMLTLYRKGKTAGMTTCLLRTISPMLGMEIPFEFQAPEIGVNRFSLVVRNAKREIVFFNQGEIDVLPPLRVSTTGFFFNGYLEAQINAAELPDAETKGTIQILKGNKTFGKEIPFELKAGKAILKVPTEGILTEDGEYQLQVLLASKTGEPFRQQTSFLFAKRPDCINPKAGRKIYFGDGWFPPKRNGTRVEVWNRVYEWKGTIFPASIISAGKEMLQEPPFFEYVCNGKTGRLSAGQIRFISQNEEMVVYEITAKDAALEFAARIHVEYDGFIGYDITRLAPAKGANITRLSLNIPLTKECAQYKLEGLEHIHTRERDYIPEYPKGGRAFPRTPLAGVGRFERALFFAHESDEGWLPYGRKNVEQIIPEKERVLWKWNLIDGAVMAPMPKILCGFQATPFKKYRENYLEDVRPLIVYPGGVFRPTDSFLDEKCIPGFKAQGANVLMLFSAWSTHFGGMTPDDMDSLKRLVKAAHKEGMRVVVYRCAICNEHEPSFVHFGELWKSMPSSSFIGNPVVRYEKRVATGRCPKGPDYVDWYVGSAQKLMEETGIDGFYYDFGEPSCSNALHGCGFQGLNESSEGEEASQTIGVNVDKLTAADRARRQTNAIMVQRELWKRMYNMVHELRGERGIIDAHTSDPARVLSMPFVDYHLHSESGAVHWSDDDLSTLDLEGYRFYFAKEIFGGPGDVIIQARRAKDLKKACRSWLSLSLLHRQLYRPYTNKYSYADNSPRSRTAVVLPFWKIIKDFGTTQAAWHPFYGEAPLATVVSGGTDRTVVSGWLKKEKAMLVVSNLTRQNRKLTLKLAPSLLGFTQAKNVETEAAIPLKGDGTLVLDVPYSYFVLIEMR